MTNKELVIALMNAIIERPEIANQPAYVGTHLYSAYDKQQVVHIADVVKISRNGRGTHVIEFDKLRTAYNTEFIS